MFGSVLNIAGMVTKTNILLAGLAVVLLGAGSFALFRPKGGGVVPSTPIQDPIKQQESQDILGLKQILKFAQQTFKQTFPTIKRIPKEQLKRSARFNLGVFAAKGVRTSIDPFSGRKVIIPFGGRASPKTRAFFTSGQGSIFGDPAANIRRVTAGNIAKIQLSDFIVNIKQQIGILESTNNVTL